MKEKLLKQIKVLEETQLDAKEAKDFKAVLEITEMIYSLLDKIENLPIEISGTVGMLN